MCKHITGHWPFLAGTVFLLAALCLFLFNTYENKQAAEQAKAVLQTLHAITPAKAPPGNGTGDDDLSNRAEIDQAIPDYILNPHMAMPTVEAAGDAYVGMLYFPALQTELPVMSAWSYPNLKKAPCLYAGSIYSGNAVIAAHNYASHFGRLTELAPGDAVYFTDVDGNVFLYEVILQEVLEPTAIEDMTAGNYDLSLFTCTLGGQARFTVRCNRR